MNPLRLPVCDLRPIVRRAGIVAFHETLFVAVVVTGLVVFLRTVVVAVVSMDANSVVTNSVAVSERGISRISLERDGRWLWVVRPRQVVERLNVANGEQEQSLPCSELDLVASAFSWDGSTAMLCGGDGSVIIWRNGEEARIDTLMRNEMIVAASVSDEGRVSACVTDQGRMHVWTREGSEFWECTYLLTAQPPVVQIGLEVTGRRIYLARSDGTISFHMSETGALDGLGFRVEAGCGAFAWSRDERFMGVVTPRGRVQVVEVATGRTLFEHPMNEASLHIPPHAAGAILQFSPDGRRLATSTITTHEIQVWDLVTGRFIGCLHGHAAPVRALQFSTVSDVLYSGSYDGTIRKWSLTTCSQRRIVD